MTDAHELFLADRERSIDETARRLAGVTQDEMKAGFDEAIAARSRALYRLGLGAEEILAEIDIFSGDLARRLGELQDERRAGNAG